MCIARNTVSVKHFIASDSALILCSPMMDDMKAAQERSQNILIIIWWLAAIYYYHAINSFYIKIKFSAADIMKHHFFFSVDLYAFSQMCCVS